MARLHFNFIGGLIEDNPLTLAATTLNSGGLSALPAVASPDIMAIVLDPDGIDGAPEIAWLTAHLAGEPTGTLLRGQEGTTAREHKRDIEWVHALTSVALYDPPTAKATRSSTPQSIDNNTETVVAFDTEAWDSDGLWTASTPGRFTIRTPGKYRICASMVWAANSTGARQITLRKNGSQYLVAPVVSASTDSAGQMSCVVEDLAVANDFYELMVWQNSGGSLNLLANVRNAMSVTRFG